MLTKPIKKTAEYRRLLAAVESGCGASALFGLPPLARAAVVCALCQDTGRPALVVSPGEAEATRFAQDAQSLGIKSGVFPSRDFVFRNIEGQSREYEYRRLEVLGGLVGRRLQMVCAPVEGVLQHSLPKASFLEGTLTISLKQGENIGQEKLIKMLFAAGYSRRSQVDGPGQFSARGDIVDIYPPDMPLPARLEFWGEELQSMHSFDLISQRREEPLKKMHLGPAREVLFGVPKEAAEILKAALNSQKGTGQSALQKVLNADIELLEGNVMPQAMDKYLPLRYKSPGNILDYMENPIVFFDEPSGIREEAESAFYRTGESIAALLEEGVLAPGLVDFFCTLPTFQKKAEKTAAIYAENFARSIPDVRLCETVNLPVHALPPWAGDIGGLAEEIRPLLQSGYFVGVLAGTQRAADALAKDLEAAGLPALAIRQAKDTKPSYGSVAVLPGRLSAGAEYPGAKFAVFTSRRVDVLQKRKPAKKGKGFASLTDIKQGDYVVHQSHGIGVYVGIQRLDLHGVVKDYLKINYDKADTLYVPVTQLDLLSRYTAPGDGEKVKLARLGGEQWAKTKARVRRATQEMAKDLIELYAKRKEAKGTAFPEDGDWQRDFETRFEYDETDDQLHSTAEIKKDMQSPHPMDRLLAGDVGVGKTEVALRAAFKCVMGGKQCAILVPTTILAWQHYNTMLSRMEAFPVKIAMLSRFASAKQIKQAIKGLADGTVDLVVGTHRLIQKDVKFKNLGLVIIDEEQRFGVRHKEKLKEHFIGVDSLTLSATPIPRTLNMAMSGIRDMSSIEEPPTERQPVETYVMEYDEAIISSAIKKELARAGQVYYLHNRVDSIELAAEKLRRLAPGARVAVAHGRMDEEGLSRVWQQLLNAEVDILVCTTLIETGVDVRNVNTLIIENADHMGLAQLYQIRGRVGRSGRKAYAYFTFRRDKVLTDVAAKRLSAIREFTAFGSGFRIAMRDLQIRGAGNLLGQSQSGHMQAVGYELYVKMLNQAVAQARGEAPAPDKTESLIDITIDAYIPESYIADVAGRIEAYKSIAAIESEADAAEVLAELKDRYGTVVPAAKGLVDISLLRVLCARLGIYEVSQQRDTILLYSDVLKPEQLKPLLKSTQLPLMFNASAKPYLAVKIKPPARPLDVLYQTVEQIVLAVPARQT